MNFKVDFLPSNNDDYPHGQVKNAFMRSGFPVQCTRTKRISHYNGPGHPSKVAATADVFANEVEGL